MKAALPACPERCDDEKTGFFRYKHLGDRVLITNDIGRYSLLEPGTFARFVQGELPEGSADARALKEAGFIKDPGHYDCMAGQWRAKNAFLMAGPGLHIVVVTLRCNHRCVYCHASSKPFDDRSTDMTEETARRVVDTILASPNPDINIEFQGGEPLANWPVVQCIIEYARERNQSAGKRLQFSCVSNMSLMDAEKLDWLLERGVNFCTSLDGPEKVHNRNRVYLGGNSHADAVRWWRVIMKRTARKIYRIDGLMTTTRFTLPYPREVVDEYVRLGSRGIYLRFLNPFGFAQKVREKIGYTPDEFLEFYRKALGRVIEVNLGGRMFFEMTARTFLTKILSNLDPNFLDLRSPCGAGIGQIAYNYDGSVYTCDEGRMLGEMQDRSFAIGRVEDGYAKIASHVVVKSLALASCLESQTECSWCAYQPYCGVCPIYNYVEQGDLFGRMPTNGRCRIYKGILDYLFTRLQEPRVRKVFERWVRKSTVPSVYRRN